MKTRTISSQASKELLEGSTTNAHGPERTMKRHERAAPRVYTEAQKAAKKAYKLRNKERYTMLNKQYRDEHREELLAYGRAYRASNKKRLLAQQKEAYRRNFERDTERRKAYYAARAAEIVARKRTRRQNDPDALAYHNFMQVRRRKAVRRATTLWADQEAILEKYKEAQRLTRETGVEYHVDHIFPLQGDNVSGLHVENNLQILPAKVNLQKGKAYRCDDMV